MANWLAGAPLLCGLALGAGIEGLTCLLRFGVGLRMADHLELVTAPTFGLRVHHGYVGAAMLAAGLLFALLGWPDAGWLRPALLAAGLGLLLSDAAHHFVVLKLVTGSCDFP